MNCSIHPAPQQFGSCHLHLICPSLADFIMDKAGSLITLVRQESPFSNFSCHSTHLGDMVETIEQALTIVCKLNPTPEQTVKLDKTLQGFTVACIAV